MVAPDARRLVVAAALRLHLARRLGPHPLPADLDAAGLRAAAEALAPGDDDGLRQTYGLTFDPPYPGRDAGVGDAPGGRLVLVSTASRGGEPAAVVVTTLVPGRAPQVSAAPPGTATSSRG